MNLEYSSLVERAQKGDTRAFSELVARFQDMAVGSAYGWLGDIELAREVSQEAFLDATLLTWYQTLDPDFDLSDLEHPDQPRIDIARAVLTYFCQPFVITEPFSGTPGEQTALKKVLDDIELILND